MLLCMTLGTGIGGALVHEGRLYRGASYAAGEVGQAYLGSSETWENWASVSALLTAAEIKRGLTLGSLTGQEFFAFVEKGRRWRHISCANGWTAGWWASCPWRGS